MKNMNNSKKNRNSRINQNIQNKFLKDKKKIINTKMKK